MGQPVAATWQRLTKAIVTRTADGLLLKQAGKTVELQVKASGNWTVDIEDVSQPRHLQDSPNPGVSRILIRVPSPANSITTLTVEVIPGSIAIKRTK